MEILVGDVKDKVGVFAPASSNLMLIMFPSSSLQVAILVDDMVDTGSTLVLAARTLREKGAKATYALITHG
jgi:ribose-phosphate pyrophosphokinase